MAEEKKTTIEMLDEQIQSIMKDMDIAQFEKDEARYKSLFARLTVLHKQKIELWKLEAETAAKNRELELSAQKLDADTAIRIREVELKEQNDKKAQEIEAQKVKEQKRSNTITGVVGGVTALTGIAGIIASIRCVNKSLRFEETGSYTSKSTQHVGGIFNLFRRKG